MVREVFSSPQPLLVRIALAIVLLGILAGELRAEKTDVVELDNGDRITGEVKKLERARLLFKTDVMGTIEIELTGGDKIYGSLVASGTPKQLRVVGESGSQDVGHADVVRITPIQGSLRARLDGSLDFGFSFVQADRAHSFTLNGELSSRSRKYLRRLLVSSALTDREDFERVQRSAGSFTLTRFVGKRWQTLVLGSAESNEELDLRLRTTVSGGVGRFAVQTNRFDLLFFGGVSVNQEKYRSAPEADQNVEALLGLRYSLFIFGDNETSLSIDTSVLPSFTVSGRVRIETTLRFRRELVKDFYLGLSLYESFDSEPPTAEAVRNDWGLATTVGYSF